MIQSQEFISSCISRGYALHTGVPCSFLKPLINYVAQKSDINYITASSEGEAVGIAAGAYLAGSKAIVMCQNSGLGNMVNPLTSLCFPFRIPILLIITLRGEPGLKDEPEHELMGKITGGLLDTLRIPWKFFPNKLEDIDRILDLAEREMKTSMLPFALILKKGDVAKTDLKSVSAAVSNTKKASIQGRFKSKLRMRMPRMDAIRIIRTALSDEDALVATTGKIGRELFMLGDSENQLYVVGSMGCAAGIGFGIQYIRSKQRVVVLDGDGATIMKMGTIATIGHYRPEQFIHVILDNEVYESTGGQRSASSTVDFCKIAGACGYLKCYRADTKNELLKAVKAAKNFFGPSLIHVKVASGSISSLPRPNLKPCQQKERFMRFLERGGGNA